jgi:hypothetical protein
VSWVLWVVAATLGVVLLWGLFAPKSSWRSLTGWSVSDPHGNEPGASSYGVRRLVSGIGALGLVGVLVVASSSFFANLPQAAPPLSAVHVMWGSPDPQVVNRVVKPLLAAPADLVPEPILGYQAFKDNGAPSYLTRLKPYSLLGKSEIPGYIGTVPDVGLAAIDTASLVINVRGPILCIPRQAVVIETDTTVQIGIFYGLPDALDGSAVDHIAGCPPDSTVTASLLIPIPLANPVGDRKVQTLDGKDIDSVRIVTDSDDD